MVGGGAWWVEVHGGWRCMVGGGAWWVEVHGGWRCMVGGGAWWVEVHGGWRCMVRGDAWIKRQPSITTSLFDFTSYQIGKSRIETKMMQ